MLLKRGSLAIVLALGGVMNLGAVVCDLTFTGATCTNFGTSGPALAGPGATLLEAGIAPTGTGNIDSFVRIQANGNEQGYNTDFRPLQYDEQSSPTFTRSLLLSTVPTVNIGGTLFREFILDINQQGADPLLTLNRIIVSLRPSGNSAGATATDGVAFGAAAGLFTDDTLVYDSGLANTIEMNFNLNAGSGKGDMFLYIPNSAFTGPNTFVYLYSEFGFGPNDTNDGFEEWAVQTAAPIPEPSTVFVLCGFIAAGALARRRLMQAKIS